LAANEEIDSLHFDKFDMHAVCGTCNDRFSWICGVLSAIYYALIVNRNLTTLLIILDCNEALTVGLREVVGE